MPCEHTLCNEATKPGMTAEEVQQIIDCLVEQGTLVDCGNGRYAVNDEKYRAYGDTKNYYRISDGT